MIIRNPFALAGLSLGTTCLLLALFVLFSGRTKLHRIWVLFNLSVAIWGFGALLIGNATNLPDALLAWRIAHIGGIFIPVCFFHTASVFCAREKHLRKAIIFAYLQGFLFLVLDATNLFISKLRFVFGSFYYNQSTGLFYPVFFFLWVSFVIWGHYELIKYYFRSSGVKRNQILYFFVGMLVGFLGGTTNFFPMFKFDIYPIGNFTIPLYCFIVTYAIFKYQLMDIKVVLTRAIVFIIVYIPVLGIPFWFGAKYNSWYIANWIMLFFATGGPFLYLYIQRKAEEKLLKEEKRAQNTLRQAAEGMARIRSLKQLKTLIVHVVPKTLKLDNASIFLINKSLNNYNLEAVRYKSKYEYLESLSNQDVLIQKLAVLEGPLVYEEVKTKAQEQENNPNDPLHEIETQMRKLGAAVIIPLSSRGRLLGFLVLGEKKSKRMYSQDDLSTLGILSYQTALAIENAMFWVREEENLVQSSKEQAASDISFGASHQFNNRLFAISMIVNKVSAKISNSVINQQGCGEELKPALQEVLINLKKIVDECQFGGQITAGIMGLTGVAAKNFADFDPGPLILSSLELVEMKHFKDKIDGGSPVVSITTRIDKNLPVVFGSDAQIRDCLFNLIDNAYDAVYEKDAKIKQKDTQLNWPEGQTYTPQIEIAAFPKDNYLVINVTDNGMGVKEEYRKMIFASYFTTKPTSVKGYGKGGHGIGVYTVRKLILAHKGRINFTSEYGKGATFTIELPIGQKGKAGEANA